MPGRLEEILPQTRHPVESSLARTDGGAAEMGHRRRRRVGGWRLVRREAVLHVVGDEELQDAHPRAAFEVPHLRSLQSLRWSTAQAGGVVVAVAEWRRRRWPHHS